jgi:serine/threonine-protein kinase HipA
LETPDGDYILSPAYDLLNTRIHINDTDFALKQGLFTDNFQSAYMRRTGHAGLDDFRELAKRFDIPQVRVEKLLTPFLAEQQNVKYLTKRSFLYESTQSRYLKDYSTRLSHLTAQ